ncbi:MAG: 16S rRNA (cytidine(1402)-2'-O)-methyltransferase [Dehalococcoidales bacterium]|jgi:16S rRNA (cytidine1402-2'-O)-methyltransferase|nr:16S rRNA (cytidine(1402)-2'-O)-methyltransferase [Dehalococcoidales bacterium]NLE89854.1 16S rRNA (cytidine(1402)-2'-O)-methyltransferase [Dehalococcoidales bacterium]
MYCLYLVATPIGNLEDITQRAIRVLTEVALIAAEDTRKTRILLKKYAIETPLCSFYEHSGTGKIAFILQQLEQGDVAVVSEAGMPGISDPGYELVVAAAEKGIRVVPVPGPSAVISAVAASALPTDSFLFLGFLPRKQAERCRFLAVHSKQTATLVLYEAPHRLISTLSDIMQVLGDRRIAVCREMTKIYEEIFRGNVSQAVKYFEQPKGEFTLVIEGWKRTANSDGDELCCRIKEMKSSGIKVKDAVSIIAGETGLKRREIYRAWLED